MPVVSKQESNKTLAPSSPKSILNRIVSITGMKISPLKILIYGGNRTGKTTFACQFAKPLLIVTFEPALSGGIDSVRRIDGISVVRVVPDKSPHFNNRSAGDPVISMDESITLARELEGNPGKFRTIVYDSVTSAQDIVLANLMDLPAIPDQMSWGTSTGDKTYLQRSEKTRESIRPYLDLPVDTIMLAKERDHNPPKEERVNERTGKVQPDMRAKFLRGIQQESFIAADLGGATTGWLQDSCDCICRLYVEEEISVKEVKVGNSVKYLEEPTGHYIRMMRTGYHPNYAAGVRSCNPEKVPDVIKEPTADKLLSILRG